MKKRILALVLALCIAASLGTVFAQAVGTFTATLDANTYAVGQNATLRWSYYPTDGISASYYEVYLNNKLITSTQMNSLLYYVDGTATNLQFYVQAYGYENGSSDPRPLGASNVVVASVTGTRNGVYFVQNLSNVQPMMQQNNTIYLPLQISVYLPTTVTNATWALYQTNRLNQTTLLQRNVLSANTSNSIASVDYAITVTQNDLGNKYYFEINYYDSAANYNYNNYNYQQQYSYQYQQQYQYQNMQSLLSDVYTLSQFSTVINSSVANPTAGANLTLSANLVPLFNNYNITNVTYQWYSGTSSVLNEATIIYGATSPTYAFTMPQSQGTYYYFCVVNALIDGATVTSTASQSFTITSGAGNMANFKQVNSGSIPFKDLSSSQWYYSYASYAYYLNLMQGSSATTFNPNGEFKISEAIAVAARMHAIYHNGTDSNFVQGTPWYQTYVDYAIQNNIIKDGDFTNYTAACTRAQMAYILCNALPSSELTALKTVSTLPDVTNNTPYATYIFMLYNAGVLTGSDKKGTFYPQNSIKRSEVSAIICRMAFKSMRSSTAIG